MKKNFPGQNLCSGAFGGNIRPDTKQRARHGSPFLEPPPLLRRAPMPSPPPPAQSNFRAAQGMGSAGEGCGQRSSVLAAATGECVVGGGGGSKHVQVDAREPRDER